MDIYKILEELNIIYEKCDHNPVRTMEDVLNEKICEKINGTESKAMFVKYKKRYYLILSPLTGHIDLNKMAETLHEPKLSLASEERLLEILNSHPGSVSPLALIYDKEKKVKVVLDTSLKGKNILMHPCINTSTVSISYEDLLKYIEYTNHEYIEI